MSTLLLPFRKKSVSVVPRVPLAREFKLAAIGFEGTFTPGRGGGERGREKGSGSCTGLGLSIAKTARFVVRLFLYRRDLGHAIIVRRGGGPEEFPPG